jgi:DNA repair exonuclease SbcCD ATPase subunit
MIKLFIDEGFGTQDPESVAVVLKRCNQLYKENQIVGISHVAMSCKNEFPFHQCV